MAHHGLFCLATCGDTEKIGETMMKTFEIFANSTPMGEVRGDNETAALDGYAREAGYSDFSDLLDNVPNSTRDEIDVFEIDKARLFDAVPMAVFQDAYGAGVAFSDGKSFASFRELAEYFELDIADFYM